MGLNYSYPGSFTTFVNWVCVLCLVYWANLFLIWTNAYLAGDSWCKEETRLSWFRLKRRILSWVGEMFFILGRKWIGKYFGLDFVGNYPKTTKRNQSWNEAEVNRKKDRTTLSSRRHCWKAPPTSPASCRVRWWAYLFWRLRFPGFCFWW